MKQVPDLTILIAGITGILLITTATWLIKRPIPVCYAGILGDFLILSFYFLAGHRKVMYSVATLTSVALITAITLIIILIQYT